MQLFVSQWAVRHRPNHDAVPAQLVAPGLHGRLIRCPDPGAGGIGQPATGGFRAAQRVEGKEVDALQPRQLTDQGGDAGEVVRPVVWPGDYLVDDIGRIVALGS